MLSRLRPCNRCGDATAPPQRNDGQPLSSRLALAACMRPRCSWGGSVCQTVGSQRQARVPGTGKGPRSRTQLREGALLRVVQLRALDDDRVRGQVHAPGQRGGCAQHLRAQERRSTRPPEQRL